MNNFMSTATRRHGDPALVSMAYPSSHPGSNASLVPGAPAARSPGTAVRERSNEGVAKPDWLGEWEEEWGEAEDWGAEIGHTLKLAVLAPITTWGILGQAIVGAGDPIDWTPLEEDEAARRTERDVYRRQRAAKVHVHFSACSGSRLVLLTFRATASARKRGREDGRGGGNSMPRSFS